MTDEQIKEIMALVADVWFAKDDDQAQVRVNRVRAAIESALRAAVPAIPAGWRLVPVEPTEAMYVAGDDAVAECRKSGLVPAGEVYRAMLSASPQAPQAAQPVQPSEQAAFEDWLYRVCPSGDVTEVQRQWEASSDLANWLESQRTEDVLIDGAVYTVPTEVACELLRLHMELQAAQPNRCPNCDDTGDVHSIDGEWRGTCHCPAGQAINAQQAAQPTGAVLKPLTIAEVEAILARWDYELHGDRARFIVRETERAHGIAAIQAEARHNTEVDRASGSGRTQSYALTGEKGNQ
jgi:hypothetical protein